MAEGLFHEPAGQRLSRPRWLAMAMLVALAAMSNLYLTAGHTVAAATRDSRLYWSAEVLAALDWLGEHTKPEDTVLSSCEVGNLIPARIGHRVVLGHWMETIDYEQKKEEVARFFAADTSDQERMALLEQYGVVYLFYGPDERALGAFDPDGSDYFARVFSQDGVRVYAVNLPPQDAGRVLSWLANAERSRV